MERYDGRRYIGTRPAVREAGVETQTLTVRRHMRYTGDRKSTRLNSSHLGISYAVFCLKKKKEPPFMTLRGMPTAGVRGSKLRSASMQSRGFPIVQHAFFILTCACDQFVAHFHMLSAVY